MEKIPFNIPEDNPKPQELITVNETVTGREIKGLEPTPEHFNLLREGEDYTIRLANEAILSVDDPRRHLVFINPARGETVLTVTPPHWRTITSESSGSIATTNGQQEQFFEANTKGVGYLKPTVRGKSLDEYDSWIGESHIDGERIMGICVAQTGHRSPESLMALSNHLIQSGLRTEAHWLVASLKQIPFRGTTTPLSQLQEQGVIPRKYSDRNRVVDPIEVVRLIKTNTRVEEAYEADDRRQEIFSEAFKTFNREARLKNEPEADINTTEGQRLFFSKFSQRIGSNLAILLNSGLSHFYLHSSNISMAAEFLDLEPVEHWTRMTKQSGWLEEHNDLRLQHIKDMRDAVHGLRKLLNSGRAEGLHTGQRTTLSEHLLAGFDSSFNPDQAKEQEIDQDSARTWLAKITNHLLIERKNLPSLSRHHISDWEIL